MSKDTFKLMHLSKVSEVTRDTTTARETKKATTTSRTHLPSENVTIIKVRWSNAARAQRTKLAGAICHASAEKRTESEHTIAERKG